MNVPLLAATAAAAICFAGTARAADDNLAYALADINADAIGLSLKQASKFSVGTQIQFRYMANSRDDSAGTLGDNDTTIGFNVRRAQIEVKGDVTEDITGKVVFQFNRSTGNAILRDGYVDWKVSDDVSLRIGQFRLPALREEMISSKRQLAFERSATNETFNQDRSQAVQASFGGDAWRSMVAFSDGFNSDNSAFNSSAKADYAFTGRFELKFGDAGWKQFDQFTSFRGAAQGLMIGAAAHYESKGDTNLALATPTDMFLFTADASFVADGWNFFGAYIFRNMDGGPGSDFDDSGAVLQGGFFVTDQTELYARWDAVFADSARGATGDDFNSITFGVNHYLIPESHAAKLTLGVGFTLDPTTTSIVRTSDGHNLLADADDGQFSITAQMQFLF
jgi:hypothetical protein